jgi:hypothetical protein
MQFLFPEDNLQRTIPEETRITCLRAEVYPDGTRLRVNLEISPFQKRPHLDLLVTNAAGEEVSSTSIIEPLTWKLEITMHLPSPRGEGRGEALNPYTLEARLFYPDGPAAEPQAYTFNVNPPHMQPES